LREMLLLVAGFLHTLRAFPHSRGGEAHPPPRSLANLDGLGSRTTPTFYRLNSYVSPTANDLPPLRRGPSEARYPGDSCGSSFFSYPRHWRTGRRGYLGYLGSVAERWHWQKTEPRSVRTSRIC
jgi:hypothetical protein